MNEEFYKWLHSYRTRIGLFGDDDMQAAYQAGAAAMKERCAEVAENMSFVVEIHELMEMTKRDMSAKTCREIAAAIRGQG